MAASSFILGVTPARGNAVFSRKVLPVEFERVQQGLGMRFCDVGVVELLPDPACQHRPTNERSSPERIHGRSAHARQGMVPVPSEGEPREVQKQHGDNCPFIPSREARRTACVARPGVESGPERMNSLSSPDSGKSDRICRNRLNWPSRRQPCQRSAVRMDDPVAETVSAAPHAQDGFYAIRNPRVPTAGTSDRSWC